jgi:hypothetical protein
MNVEHLLRKITGSKQSQPSAIATWAEVGKVIGVRLPKLFRAHIMPPYAPDSRHKATGF